jgi:hypothetical protein
LVNELRVKQKLSILLTDGPWYSSELDSINYQLKKYRVEHPEKYTYYFNNIVKNLTDLRRELDDISLRKRTMKMNRAGYVGDPKLFSAATKKVEPWRL